MPLQVPKFSEEEREAVVRAAVEDELVAETIVELAAKGELYGLPPFEIGATTVRELARKERRKRPSQDESDPAVEELSHRTDALIGRALGLIEGRMGFLEKQAIQNGLSPRNAPELKHHAAALREIKMALKTGKPGARTRRLVSEQDNGRQAEGAPNALAAKLGIMPSE